LEKNKDLILSKIAEVDDIQHNRSLTDEEAIQKTNLFMDFEDYAKEEEIKWRQRSRTLWIKRSDKNTKFFWRIADARKRNNYIDHLPVGWEDIVEPENI